MALARLALKNLQQRASSQSSAVLSRNALLRPYWNEKPVGFGAAQEQGWRCGLLQRFASASGSEGKEVAVETDQGGRRGGRWRSLLPRRLRRPSLWRRRETREPFDIFSTAGLGSLLEAAENMNRVFENIIPTQMIAAPTQLMGRLKETKDSYKLRFEVPGLTKEELKVTADDGVLRIRGERKVEEGDEDEDEYMMSYGFYNTSLALPDDAKVDEIKAELKDGVLNITIPKTEAQGKDVKEIQIQ